MPLRQLVASPKPYVPQVTNTGPRSSFIYEHIIEGMAKQSLRTLGLAYR